jgi:hypothetical protein
VHARTGSLRARSFGVFEVDLRAVELRKFGIKIKLQQQPFQLLALLLTHPGELLTRDERQALWPEHTFVDFDPASQVFEKTKTQRDAAMADLVQTKALPMEGSPTEARLLIDQSIRIAQTSHDRELKLSARVIAAGFQIVSKNPVGLNAHRATLRKQADRRGFPLVERKAAAALHVAHDQASGQRPSQNKNRELSRSTRA